MYLSTTDTAACNNVVGTRGGYTQGVHLEHHEVETPYPVAVEDAKMVHWVPVAALLGARGDMHKHVEEGTPSPTRDGRTIWTG